MTYGLKEDVKKAKEENKKVENKFFNALLNICVINAVVDWEDKDPTVSRSGLFWPETLFYDQSILWVGEYKFSGRVLGFEHVE